MTPDQVRTRTFRLTARGYDRVEVSSFLAVIAAELEDVQRRVEPLAIGPGADPAPPDLDAYDDMVIDLRDPFSVFAAPGARMAPQPVERVRRYSPSVSSVFGGPRVDVDTTDATAPPTSTATSPSTSTLPPPPHPAAPARLPAETAEGFGRHVAELLRRAEADAAEIRTRARAELEDARRQSAILRSEVELQSREHVEGVLADFRATIARLAGAEREARDRLRSLNESITLVLAGAIEDGGPRPVLDEPAGGPLTESIAAPNEATSG